MTEQSSSLTEMLKKEQTAIKSEIKNVVYFPYMEELDTLENIMNGYKKKTKRLEYNLKTIMTFRFGICSGLARILGRKTEIFVLD